MEEEKKTITPSQYFDYVKGAKKQITTEALKNSYGVFISLAEKYSKLGQTESLKKLSFLVDTLIKEEKLIELGITTYVYKDVIEDYITNVADKTVKIIELSRYMREIPDLLVDTITKSRDIFDEIYVVFTDYTGKLSNSSWQTAAAAMAAAAEMAAQDKASAVKVAVADTKELYQTKIEQMQQAYTAQINALIATINSPTEKK